MLRISTRLAAVVIPRSCWLVLTSRQTTAQAPQAAGVIALTNARVIDGTGRPAVERATIVMRNGRIEAFGNAAVPAGAVRVDMTGKTIMPGIINAHGHAQGAESEDSGPRGSNPAASDVRQLRRDDGDEPRRESGRRARAQAARRAEFNVARSCPAARRATACAGGRRRKSRAPTPIKSPTSSPTS